MHRYTFDKHRMKATTSTTLESQLSSGSSPKQTLVGDPFVTETVTLATAVRTLRPHTPHDVLAPITGDARFREELQELRAIERTHREPGVDLSRFLSRQIQHPFLREWMRLSDEALDQRPGRADLRRRRRHGVLRLLDGDDRAMPFDVPPLALVPTVQGIEMKVYDLFDEAEFHVLAFRQCGHPAVPTRPVKEVLYHRDLRALFGVRASTLDSWLSLWPQMIGGLRRTPLGQRRPPRGNNPRRPRETTHRVTADTMSFMIWLIANQN
jgi:hypothetical protein